MPLISLSKADESDILGRYIKGVSLSETDLSRVCFKEVIDFTRSHIDGMIVSGGELKGAIVSAYQASELAKLLGLIVK